MSLVRDLRRFFAPALLVRFSVLAAIVVLIAASIRIGPMQLFPSPWDKLVHITMFYLISRSIGIGFRCSAGMIVLCGALIGLTDEMYQLNVPDRNASAYDWLADVAGASLAAWVGQRETLAAGS